MTIDFPSANDAGGRASPGAFPALCALLKDYGAILQAEVDACADTDGVFRDGHDAARVNEMMRLYRDGLAELEALA